MKKVRINLKRSKIAIFLVFFVAVVVGGAAWYSMNQNKQAKGDGIVISTNKSSFDKGEIIKISVKNNLKEDIFYYYGSIGRDVKNYKDGIWQYVESGKNQIQSGMKKNVRDSCSLILYERANPLGLKSGKYTYDEWNQQICDLGSNVVKYTESGQYRLSFTYGLKISSDDEYAIEDAKTIYSDNFTIK